MGRPQFNTQTIISAVTSKKLMRFYQENTTPLNAGGREVVEFYAPQGYIVSKVVSLYFVVNLVNSVETSKRHLLSFYPSSSWSGIQGHAYGKSVLKFVHGNWTDADFLQFPKDPASQAQALSNMAFDDKTPSVFYYDNLTDSVQNNKRQYELICLIEKVS